MPFYPHRTIVHPLLDIERERSLTRDGNVMLRRGQATTPVSVVAKTMVSGKLHAIHASNILDVPPEDVSKYLLVEAGTGLQKGTPILQKRGTIGRNRRISTPTSGVLTGVEHGYVLFEERPRELEVRAMLAGRVTEIIPNRGAKIQTTGALIEGVWGTGRDGHGQLQLLTNSPTGVPTEDQFVSVRGMIVVAGHLNDPLLVERAEENGARGFVVGSVTTAVYLARRNFSIPILVTDGIGQRPMATPIFDLIGNLNGQEGSLLTRATGNQPHRPELIVPKPDNFAEYDELTLPVPTLAPGQQVRILGPLHAGQVGKIINIYEHGHQSRLGIRSPAATVTLPNGRYVVVPLQNLDLI
ncbi:MAG: hypothetical protein KDD89_01560 [Anaerolineales bacterium]|nr:hypothetical protein [Anaerolineales bacterium]